MPVLSWLVPGRRALRTRPAALRANPCPEVTDPSCRLPLPTFSHQLEAAHLGDLLRLSVRPAATASVPRLFRGRQERPEGGTPPRSARPPSSPPKALPRAAPVRRKRKLPSGLLPASPGSLALPPSRARRYRKLGRFPFRGGRRCAVEPEFPRPLGSTHPGPTAVPPEPCSTSVFKAPT